jgi:hypothetical protein
MLIDGPTIYEGRLFVTSEKEDLVQYVIMVGQEKILYLFVYQWVLYMIQMNIYIQ